MTKTNTPHDKPENLPEHEAENSPENEVPTVDDKAATKPKTPPKKDDDACNPEPKNPFDPANLRMGQDFASELGIKKHLIAINVRKPSRQEWVRSNSDASYRLDTYLLNLKDERETYLVLPELHSVLFDEVSPFRLTLGINRQMVPFLWMARLPKSDGKTDAWMTTALRAEELAQGSWVRMSANMPAGLYDVFEAAGDIAEPEWPTQTFPELLELAFKDRFIRDLEHPVIRRLKGLA